MNKKFKVGYNWIYRISVQMLNGESAVIVDEELYYRHRNGFEDHLLSGYPGGNGRCEDLVAARLRQAFRDLFDAADEYDITVCSGSGGPWGQYRVVIEGRLDSPMIIAFIDELELCNRVSVVVNK